MRPSRFRLLVEIIPVLLIACSVETPEQPSTPLAPSLAVNDGITPNGAFYPLAEGNEWHYRYRLEMQLIPDDGPAPPPEVLDDTIVRSQGEMWVPNGTGYRAEWDDDGSLQVPVNYFRQDRRGLYMFDLLVTASPSSDAAALSLPRAAEPTAMSRVAAHLTTRVRLDPACVAEHLRKVSLAKVTAGSSPGDGRKPEEALILAYPLHPGASWVVRTTPMVRATVEGVDQIGGSPAYRVRLDNELLGPADVVYYWYGRCGLSQYRLHVESPATDEGGAIIGRIVGEESWDLVSVDIARGGCDVRADIGESGGGVNSYPIAVGNRWTYEIKYWDPLLTLETIVTADERQTGWVDSHGQTYMEDVTTARAPSSWRAVALMRQDRDGLYTLDASGGKDEGVVAALSGAMARSAGGALDGEATTLVYPLKTGASWTIRDNPKLGVWTATVEGREDLSVPAGDFHTFRIRITRNEGLPGDWILAWYGPVGLVKLSARSTALGNYTEEWTLQEYELAR